MPFGYQVIFYLNEMSKVKATGSEFGRINKVAMMVHNNETVLLISMYCYSQKLLLIVPLTIYKRI